MRWGNCRDHWYSNKRLFLKQDASLAMSAHSKVILHWNGQIQQAVKTSREVERVNLIQDLVGKPMQKMVWLNFQPQEAARVRNWIEKSDTELLPWWRWDRACAASAPVVEQANTLRAQTKIPETMHNSHARCPKSLFPTPELHWWGAWCHKPA